MGDWNIRVVDEKEMEEFQQEFDKKIAQLKIIDRLNEQYNINLWELLENDDFLLLAKYVSEKQPFLYEPNRKRNK